MPRNGGGVFSLASTYEAISGEVIEAQQHNDPLEDLEQDANAARPIVAGGTGATTAAAARTSLGLGYADDTERAAFRSNIRVAASPQIFTSGGYTALAADRSGVLVFTTAAQTLALTAAATLGADWFVDVVAFDVAVTIDPNSTEQIDGAATLFVPPGQSCRLWCTGTSFRTDIKRLDFETIYCGTLSGASNYNFTDLAAYSTIEWELFNLPATNGSRLFWRVSTDNGSNYIATNTYYEMLMYHSQSAAATLNGYSGLNSGVEMNPALILNTAGMSSRGTLFNFNKARYMTAHHHGVTRDSVGDNLVQGLYTTMDLGTTARNALRLLTSTGNASIDLLLKGKRG